MRLEGRHQPVLPLHQFTRRVAIYGAIAGVMIAGSLGIGVVGYHIFGGLPWMDALLNASMILTGMGPVDRMETASGKLFASAYAVFSGVAFLSIVGILMAPVVHRFLHHFHLEIEGRSKR